MSFPSKIFSLFFSLPGFHRETVESVRRSIDEKHSIANAVLEINGLKFAYNASARDCILASLTAIFETCDFSSGDSLKKVIRPWSRLISKFIQGADDQYETLVTIQEYAATHEVVAKFASVILSTFYDTDVLEEEAIRKWFKKLEASELKTKVLPFISWLDTAEEEDEE